MVRTDDGRTGVVELTAMPGFEQYEELRIVYLDRGEKRIAGKREAWTAEVAPPRKLRDEEIMRVAGAADRMLEALDQNKPTFWWEMKPQVRRYDPELISLITGYLQKRG
jgi:hypothetical protein